MSTNISAGWQPSNPARLSKHFSRLGWLGFWIQAVLLVIPVLLLVYVLFVTSPESAQQRGIDLSNYFSFGNLLVMLFTTFWFYRYTRLGKRIVDPDGRPPEATVTRTLWIGIWASCLGILFSMVLMMNKVGWLRFVLLATPQTGIPVTAPIGGDPATTLSAIDAIGLATLLKTLTGELIVLAFSLWLLFRVTRPGGETTEAAISEGKLAGRG